MLEIKEIIIGAGEIDKLNNGEQITSFFYDDGWRIESIIPVYSSGNIKDNYICKTTSYRVILVRTTTSQFTDSLCNSINNGFDHQIKHIERPFRQLKRDFQFYMDSKTKDIYREIRYNRYVIAFMNGYRDRVKK